MRLAIMLPGGVDRTGEDRVIHSRLWLIERLARRHEVHVFAMRQEQDPGDWELLGAQIHNIGMAPGSTRRLVARFTAEHKSRSFDLIHAFFGWCGASAAIVGWRCRVPVLFHPSGGEFVALRDIGYGMRCTLTETIAIRLAVAGARRITVATPHMQQLARRYDVAAEVVPLGVALDKWPPAEPRARDAAQPIRLLHIGDVRPVKDQSLLMAAAGILRDAGLTFELDVAGLGTSVGVLRHDALRALVERADILLMTSRHEAGPLVVLEAAVAGVPTVGTSVGHVAEWAPAAAVAVPVGDYAAMAQEVLALAADEPRRLAIAREAQRRAIAIDADFTAAAFERIYMDMLSGK